MIGTSVTPVTRGRFGALRAVTGSSRGPLLLVRMTALSCRSVNPSEGGCSR
jgi:hypothetical protein